MRALVIGLRTLAREWRSGDLAVLFVALVIAVAALTGVGFLVDRVDRAMQLTASEVLAADLRLTSPREIGGEYAEEARARGLRTSRVTTLLSVILLGDASQLSNVHAVTEGYPLRGRVKVADVPFGTPADATGIPAPGEVWPDSRLAAALGAEVGDELSVGATTLRVTRILVSRPDQGSGFVDLAPSTLINEADLAATGLIREGSRVRYAALFATDDRGDAARFRDWLAENRAPAERLRDIVDASPEIGNASARAGRFLSLASLTSVLLCAIAVALTARRYMQRHFDIVALMKTLGATQRFVLVSTTAQLVVIAAAAAVLGAGIGFGAQAWLLHALRDMLSAELPPASPWPLVMGFGTAVLMLIGFALPSMLQLSRVPAIRILRRDTGPPPVAAILAYGPAVVTIAVLIAWVVRDPWLAMGFVGGLAGSIVLLAGAGLLLVKIVSSLRGRVGVAWRYGLANLARRRAESIAQIVAFGLGLSAMLLLAVIRGDLIGEWHRSLPEDAPNYFFVNIPPEDREAFQQFLDAEGAQLTRLLPMIRARMTHINGTPVDQLQLQGDGENFAQREQNLSWSAELGDANRITEGEWFGPEDHGASLVSVATEWKERLGLKLGDRLRFDVAGETYEVTISSFRQVRWDSLQPNFFLMFPPGLLDAAAGTWLTSAHFTPAGADTIARLVRRFPSVSVFDMDDLLAQVRDLLGKAVLAVQSVFLFTLLAGLTVLLAAVQATRDERRFESAMLRTLGARRSTVLNGVLVEFAAIGLLAGLLGALVASVGGWLIATRSLDIPWRLNPWLWLAGLGAGALVVGLAGLMATRTAVTQPPIATLRQG